MNILVPCKLENFTNYMEALTLAHLTPIHALAIFDTEGYDWLILPGGGYIDTKYFNEPNNGSKGIDTGLDGAQFKLLHQFLNAKKPILGICKGMQMINVAFGGNIIQNLSTASHHQYVTHDQVHLTHTISNSFLHSLYGEEFSVNSAHHQGCGRIGNGLKVIQYSKEDNVVEGICHETLPILGLQWHPERMCGRHLRRDTVDGSPIFSFFTKWA